MNMTPKQERFCTSFIESGNASEAYRTIYHCDKMKPASVNRKAAELLSNGKITARIKVLNSMHQERHNINVDKLTNDAKLIYKAALESGQFASAVSALALMAKLHGLLDVKTEPSRNQGRSIEKPQTSVKDMVDVDAILRKAYGRKPSTESNI